jgi:hypothetical protein
MRVKYRYTFRNDKDSHQIITFLDSSHIKYKITSGIPLAIVEIFENDDYWLELDELMKKHGISSLIEKVFEKSEIKDAEWRCLSS